MLSRLLASQLKFLERTPERRYLAGGLGVGLGTLALADFLDHAAAGSGAADAAYRSQVGFAANDGQPGDAVIQHRRDSNEGGVVERGKHSIGWEKVA